MGMKFDKKKKGADEMADDEHIKRKRDKQRRAQQVAARAAKRKLVDA